MKIGMVSDSLGHLSFEAMLDTAARLGVKGVEINAANWTSAPHMRLAGLLASSAAPAASSPPSASTGWSRSRSTPTATSCSRPTAR